MGDNGQDLITSSFWSEEKAGLGGEEEDTEHHSLGGCVEGVVSLSRSRMQQTEDRSGGVVCEFSFGHAEFEDPLGHLDSDGSQG